MSCIGCPQPQTECGRDIKTDPSLGHTVFLKGELGLLVSLMALHNLPSTAWQSAMLQPKLLPLSLHMRSYLRSSLMALPALPSLSHYFHSGVFPNKILAYLIARWCLLFEGPELTQLPSSFLVWVGDFVQLWVSYFLTGLLNELVRLYRNQVNSF